MENFISRILIALVKRTTRQFYSYEKGFGYDYFIRKKIDKSFDYKRYLKVENPFFAKYGFHYSKMEGEYFALCTGIRSDYYVPYSLWNEFIYPYLNRDTWRWPYTDKNMFYRLLDMDSLRKRIDISLPDCEVYNCNGIFFDGRTNERISREQAANMLLSCTKNLIIKPTWESNGGKGVELVECTKLNEKSVNLLFDQYNNRNFTLQHLVQQHSDLASFNPTSVNTIRISTYMNPMGEVKIVSSVQRFGMSGSVKDNASSGGRFVGIHEDGTYMRDIHRFAQLKTEKLPDNVAVKVPCWEKVKAAVCEMHYQLPQFGFISWDMTVTPDNHLVLIEYNFRQSYELPQECIGPLFPKEDLEEIMESVSKAKLKFQTGIKVSFPDKPQYTMFMPLLK